MSLVLPLAFAVASALAGAPTGAALTGDPAFEDAMRLYKALEYEEAIPKLDAIVKRPAIAPADKATALMWLGLSHAGAGDMDAARVSLKEALVADATVALPEKVSPRIATLFDELKAEIAREAPADPPPPDQPPEAAPSDDAPDPMLIGGGVAAGIGALAIVGGAVLAVLAAGALDTANDPEQFQSDAKAALDTANAEVAGAAVLLPVGAALAAAGGVLLGLSLSE